MSRCFPFPPPGYMRNGACSEALIESIKLRREREKAKKGRKEEKKREKKEKRKEGKERKEKEGKASRTNDGRVKEFKVDNVECYRREKIKSEPGAGCRQKDDENDQLERSVITEEHDQPVSTRDHCSLSDSTQSSNKRKRSTSPSSQDNGAVLRIRLPLRKHREAEESQSGDQLGSTFVSVGTPDLLIQETNGRVHQLQSRINAETYQCVGSSGTELCQEIPCSIPESAKADLVTDSRENKSPSMISAHDSLFQKWVPPLLSFLEFDSDDQEWLFRSELQEKMRVSTKVKSVTADTFRCSSVNVWPPRAQLIPEAEIHALPYSIPF